MKVLVPLYVTLSTFVEDRVERLRRGDDRGAQGIEYAALVVLAAAVIGIFYKLGLVTRITSKVTEAIDTMFNGGSGSGTPNPPAPQPT